MVIKESHFTAFLVFVGENHVKACGLHTTALLATKQVKDLDVLRLVFRPKEELTRL